MSNMKSPLPQCASMVRIQNILSGKWKITILWYISEYEIQRFGELRRRLGDITQSTLTKQLRELDFVTILQKGLDCKMHTANPGRKGRHGHNN